MNSEDTNPHPLHRRKTLNNSFPRFYTIDGWLLMKWHICASLIVVLRESSKIELGFINFVQSGLQNSSQESTNSTIWQAFWGPTFIMKVTPFTDSFSVGLRHGLTIMPQKADTIVLIGKIWHGQTKKKKKKSELTHWWETWCWHFSCDTQGPILEQYQERARF